MKQETTVAEESGQPGDNKQPSNITRAGVGQRRGGRRRGRSLGRLLGWRCWCRRWRGRDRSRGRCLNGYFLFLVHCLGLGLGLGRRRRRRGRSWDRGWDTRSRGWRRRGRLRRWRDHGHGRHGIAATGDNRELELAVNHRHESRQRIRYERHARRSAKQLTVRVMQPNRSTARHILAAASDSVPSNWLSLAADEDVPAFGNPASHDGI